MQNIEGEGGREQPPPLVKPSTRGVRLNSTRTSIQHAYINIPIQLIGHHKWECSYAPEPRGKLRQVAAARGRHLAAPCRDLQGARGKLRQLTATYRDICGQIGRAATCGNLRQLAVQTVAASCGNLPRLAIWGATATCGNLPCGRCKPRPRQVTASYGNLRQLAVRGTLR